MLRQHGGRILSRFLQTRIQSGAQAGLSSACRDKSQPEATQFKSLSAWFDNFGARAAEFSSSSLRSADNHAQAEGTAPKGKRNARAEAELEESGGEKLEEELLSSAEEEQPYAELSRKEMLEALSEKDKALTSSSDRTEELTDLLKRSVADMENLRQRTARQAESTQKYAIQGFVKSLLDVGDNLERANGAVPPEALEGKDSDGGSLSPEKAVSLLNGIANGLKLTEKIYFQALEQNGVKKYWPEGDKFDPNLHDALFELPDPSKEPGTVGVVTKSGYLLHDRVVRPAQVGVVRPPSQSGSSH